MRMIHESVKAPDRVQGFLDNEVLPLIQKVFPSLKKILGRFAKETNHKGKSAYEFLYGMEIPPEYTELFESVNLSIEFVYDRDSGSMGGYIRFLHTSPRDNTVMISSIGDWFFRPNESKLSVSVDNSSRKETKTLTVNEDTPRPEDF